MSAKSATRKFTIYLPSELGRRADFTARNLGKAADTFLSDVVACAMEDLPDVASDGADGVETLLGLAQQANVEACAKAADRLREIIEAETFPAVVAARLETGIQPLKP